MKLEKTFILQMYDPIRDVSVDGVSLLDIKEFLQPKKTTTQKTKKTTTDKPK